MQIIIDTVAQNIEGDETIENFNLFCKEMNFLQKLYQNEMLFIHHPGKDISKGSRGRKQSSCGLRFYY